MQPAETQPLIEDPDFRQAVELIDAGNASELRDWIETRPHLLSDSAAEDGSFAGDYFANPKLLWFVAENPIRNASLPDNIAEVTQVLIDLGRKYNVSDLDHQIDHTLSLVTSGLVARQCNVQGDLVKTLVQAGADPDGALLPALAHRETEACQALLDNGAKVTLLVAAGMGMLPEMRQLMESTDATTRQNALVMAAINGQPETTRILLQSGADPNAFNPVGMHGHSTPLHQAIDSGSLDTVRALMDSEPLDVTIRDTIFDGNARDWALHCNQPEIAGFLDQTGK